MLHAGLPPLPSHQHTEMQPSHGTLDTQTQLFVKQNFGGWGFKVYRPDANDDALQFSTNPLRISCYECKLLMTFALLDRARYLRARLRGAQECTSQQLGMRVYT
eukprot:1064734-Amphidinium_carterae.1